MVLRQPLAVLLLLCGVCAAADARRSLQDGATTAKPAAEMQSGREGALLELTNATLAARLAAAASPERCIIFTTTSAFLPPLLNMTRNWFAHLHKCAPRALPSLRHRPQRITQCI